MLKINEIFHSIQGESSWVGQRTVFVRLSGCHLRCSYCDTKYAYYEGMPESIESITEKVLGFQAQYVCVTGGEPLLQPEVYQLMKNLCDLGLKVSLETSGDIDCGDVDPRVKKIIDIKTPSSGAAGKFKAENLRFATAETEFKFVICSEEDFFWAERFCQDAGLFKKSNVLYSPSFRVVSEQWLAEKILSAQSPARLQLQLHKYIWSPESRGV